MSWQSDKNNRFNKVIEILIPLDNIVSINFNDYSLYQLDDWIGVLKQLRSSNKISHINLEINRSSLQFIDDDLNRYEYLYHNLLSRITLTEDSIDEEIETFICRLIETNQDLQSLILPYSLDLQTAKKFEELLAKQSNCKVYYA